MFQRERLLFLLDRTAVLFIGLAAGAIITLSFFASGEEIAARTSVAPAASALAVEQPAPAPRLASLGPNLAAAAVQHRTVHVAVFGDSFGDGIWWALNRQLREDNVVEIHRFSRASTGFANNYNQNVFEHIRAMVDTQAVDIAVVSFGANDAQAIYADGIAADYMSDSWQRIMGERVAAAVQLLRDRGAMVYWVGLPRMRAPAYDSRIQRMNAFYAQRMRALHVPFIDTAPLSVDGDGHYAPYLPDPRTGERQAMRANDGIHMTMNGYTLLTRGLAGNIRSSIAEARGLAARIGGSSVANRGERGTRSQG